MEVNFYKSYENPLKVNKILTATTVKTIASLGNMSLIEPSFIVDKDNDVIASNYCYIPDFSRYYFIKNSSIMDGGRILIECNVDVLNSFDLSKCIVTVLRNGGIGKPTKIPDTKLPILPNENIINQTVDINTSLSPNSEYCYVLGCIGGEIE